MFPVETRRSYFIRQFSKRVGAVSGRLCLSTVLCVAARNSAKFNAVVLSCKYGVRRFFQIDYVPTRRLAVHKLLNYGADGRPTLQARELNGPVPLRGKRLGKL